MNDSLDPQVVNLAKAIRQVESGGNATAQGKSGEFGAYQFVPGTWDAYAKEAGVNVPLNQATLEQQNEVAYKKLKSWKDQGYNVGQVASMWNAGPGRPNAYLEGNSGVNDKGVAFDTAAYAKKVAEQYQQFKGQGGQSTQTPGGIQAPNVAGGYAPPSAPTQSTQETSGIGEPQAPESLGGKALDVAKGVGNFFFPIVGDVYHDIKGDSEKTALQQVGDAGLSALPFIPGLGEIGLAGKVAGNAAIGYGAGVASNLGQGQGVGQALTPQLSNVGGAVLGGAGAAALEKLSNHFSDTSAIGKMQSVYEDALGATKSGIRKSSKIAARGTAEAPADSPAEFLAKAGIAPETEEVNGRRVFKTGEDSQTYKTVQERASALTDLRDKLIDSAGAEDLGGGMTLEHEGASSVGGLQEQALQKAQTQFAGREKDKAIDYINDEFEALKRDYGDSTSLVNLNKIKKYFQKGNNYDATRPALITQVDKMIAAVARQQVETDAEKAGIPGIGELNKAIQQHLDFLNTQNGGKGILHTLNGQTVKGGRLGTYMRELVGAGAGAAAGHAMGGGPVGEFAGTIAGGIAGNRISKLMQKFAVGGPGFSARIGKIAQEDPELIQQLVQLLKERGGDVEGLVAPQLAPAAARSTSGLVPTSILRGLQRTGAAGNVLSPGLGQ